MRLFRVDREWPVREDGSHVIPELDRIPVVCRGEDGPGIYFGDGEAMGLALPVGRDLSKPFEDNEELQALPLRAARLGKDPYRLLLPTREEIRRLDKGCYYGDCLVHVCLPRVENCKVTYRASTYEELVVQYKTHHKVERVYFPIEEAIGVKLIFISDDEHEAIFELYTGASFRICRDEATVPRGESPVLVFAFDGREGKCFRPTKFKHRPRRRPNRRRKKEEVVSAAYSVPS